MRRTRPPFLAVFGLGTSPPAPLLAGEGAVRRAHAAREAWRFALGRGRYQRATTTIEDHLWLTFRTFWCVFWGISLDQTSPGRFCLGGYSNRANMFQRPKDWPWDSTCVAPHACKSHSSVPTAGVSHRPAHQLLRSRNLGQRHSTTATRARQASTSASIRLPSTVLACPNAYALQVLAADSARPPAQSPLGVALERTRVRTRSVTTHATLPL